MNKCIPEHIDPREPVERPESEVAEIRALSEMMHQSGDTPYRYVRRAFRELCQGNSIQAMRWLDYAGKFTGVFHEPGSLGDRLYRESISVLRYTMLMLVAEFEALGSDE